MDLLRLLAYADDRSALSGIRWVYRARGKSLRLAQQRVQRLNKQSVFYLVYPRFQGFQRVFRTFSKMEVGYARGGEAATHPTLLPVY